MELKEYRTHILRKIIETVIKKEITVYRLELNDSICFTGKGIEKCIQQPIYNDKLLYSEKMELIENRLLEALESATYLGFSEHQTHPKPHVVGYHYFETKTESGASLYFNVQLTAQKRLVLYSITQSIRPL